MSEWTLKVQDGYVSEVPAPQHAIDLFEVWTSKLPIEGQTGSAHLFDDGRVEWAIGQIGGVADRTVLELGPLEGGHTYMLHRAGAAQITAIEANRPSFLKCLVVKELFGLNRARFLLGNFAPYLRSRTEPVDVIWAAGVLYHMTEPLQLVHDIGRLTSRVHIWTHYIPDNGIPEGAPWAEPIQYVESRSGIEHFVRSYFDQGAKPTYCGGVHMASSWLKRSDILRAMEEAGFRNIALAYEAPDHPHGPAFAIAATK